MTRRPLGFVRSAGFTLLIGATLATHSLSAQQRGVAGTLHNLSVSGPGEIRSLTETEVCKFCHIPHNPVVAEPLWGHALPEASRYETPAIRSSGGIRVPAPQPDGASRLCLSCHDGTVALGDVAGEPSPIPMAGSQRLSPGHRGFLGTDLTGSHPVSFVLSDEPLTAEESSDLVLRPRASIEDDPDVRLDARGRMQCTTCHDPHSDRHYVPDRVPRFWVKPTLHDVCLVCHELR